jgi:hypothetical protein
MFYLAISVKKNKDDSKYATHILNKKHLYDKTGNIMYKIDYAVTSEMY